jgi:ABC-2 type transport system ATP-binding protein
MIELRNLTKRYGRITAVNRLNLSIPRGELFGFIGPNGAGKTTTIRMIGGLLAPTAGTVIIDGIDMTREPERAKKRIGLIPDRPFLYEKLTGMEFMRFIADFYDVDHRSLDENARRLLAMFGLEGRSHELIESYSHGMKQRLIMSAAMLHEPPLIVVDEPMVGLDPRGIKMVRDLFRDMARNGATIFMSTHTLKLAEAICDRIGVINDGNLIAVGTVAELRAAARLGEANLEQAFLELTRSQGAP